MKIALLFPPGAPFEQPYLSLPSLTAFLRQNKYDAIQRDINIEVLSFFLTTSRLKKSYKIISKTLRMMEDRNKLQYYHDIDKYTLLVKLILTAPYIIDNIEEAKSVFRDENKFFDPSKYKWARKIVEGALELSSAEFYPTQWTPSNYTTKFSNFSSKDILRAVHDAPTNIFLDFFRKNTIPSVLKEKPSIVGISITYMAQIIPAFTLAYLIKKADKNIHVTVGGALIANFWDNLKTNKKLFSIVDSFIVFEGEHALMQLAHQIEHKRGFEKVPNIIYRDKGRIRFNKSIFIENINSLPAPCFDGLPLNAYFSPFLVIPFEISRGCYWNKCVFCAVSAATRLSYRRKNTMLVIKEVRDLSKKYKTPYFFFCVDVAAPGQLVSLSEQLQRENLKIYWQCEARLEKGFTRAACDSISRSGCRQLIFGLESASQKVLDLMKKGTKVANFKSIIQNCYKSHIAVNLQYFFGFPGETGRDRRKTSQFISDNRSFITSVSYGRFGLPKRSKICENPLRYGITKIIENPKEDLSLSYNFKEKLKNSPDFKFPTTTDYDWLGMPYNAHSLLFFSRYNVSYLNKLIALLPQPPRKEYKNLLDWKPRKNKFMKIKKCNYNFYKMIEYIGKKDFSRKTSFSHAESYAVSYKDSVPFIKDYTHIKDIIDLCNGKNTVNRITTLLIEKYPDKHFSSSYVFGRYINLIKSLKDYDVLS